MKIKKYALLGLLLAGLLVWLDQKNKDILVFLMTDSMAMDVCPYFNLVMVWNKGISFGMLSGLNQALPLIILSCVIISILLYYLYKSTSLLVALAIGSVIGGAASNVIDRLRYGAVADFFDAHIGKYHWPAFNVADSLIFIGVVVLCAHSMFSASPKRTIS